MNNSGGDDVSLPKHCQTELLVLYPRECTTLPVDSYDRPPKKSETDVFGRMCPGINNEYDEEMRPISYSFFLFPV
jgi:hypothetical protein